MDRSLSGRCSSWELGAGIATATSCDAPAATAVCPAPALDIVSSDRASAFRRVRLQRWVTAAAGVDVLAAAVAVAGALVVRLGIARDAGQASHDVGLAAAMIPLWVAAMAFAGAYASCNIPAGSEQYRRVVNGAVWVLAVAASISFALRADFSREFVLVALPSAAVLTLTGRWLLRTSLHRRLTSGCSVHRVLAIGLAPDIRQLDAHMNRAAFAGFRVVAAIGPAGSAARDLPDGVVWAGSDVADVVAQAQRLGADTIAVLATHLLPPGQLRRLSWELEETDIDLVLAPAITDVAGPRISTRPVAGLPVLCLEKPQFAGPRRFVKEVVDRIGSLTGLVLLAPLLIAIALAVKLTSSGPVLYRQERVGTNGSRFQLLKFRSMRDGAHDERPRLFDANEQNGPLFKIRRDPRLTSIGGFLRRWSLDELPQLWNVLTGDMSLVGPRPPLPSEVERYVPDVYRRLLVKPGLTGLWQISGRSDLSWEESVRLDLHYVDNWSVGLDFVLLAKTCISVLRGAGAY